MKSGMVLVNKPAGMTSFDCIRTLKRLWKRTDLGHGGTLDRFATGLLPVMAGEGLKLARFFMEDYPTLPTYWKSYAGVFQFGRATETGDPEGATIETRPVPTLTLESVQAAMDTFVGVPYEQVPPKYSAKKVGGERSSDLAREGKAPELAAVPVTVRRFKVAKVDQDRVFFEVECSKGTYVRVLATDLARRMDSTAFTEALCRISVGKFHVSDALTLEKIEELGPEESLLDLSKASAFLPDFPILSAELDHLRFGKTDGILARLANSGLAPGPYRAVLNRDSGSLPVALIEMSPDRRTRFLRAFPL